MHTHTSSYSDAIDTRVVFKTYAIVAWAAGWSVAAWGPMWFGVDLPGLPYGLAVPERIVGSIVAAAGFLAWAMARVSDVEGRRLALYWFAVAHAVVLVMVAGQLINVWGGLGVAAQIAVGALFGAVFLFAYFGQTANGHPMGRLGAASRPSLFGPRGPSVEQLRSEYEEQIRLAAGQEERNRLARELHDSVKQQLFAIQTAAATAQARFEQDRPGSAAALDQVRSAARDAMTEMEVMLDQLRAAPLENSGLVEALKRQCEALGFRTGADVRFELRSLPPNERMPPGSQQAVFRVAQEAFANVARHARPSRATVTLDADEGRMLLTVADDGAGFDASQASTAGMGLGNMRARAAAIPGDLQVQGRPGQGTTVTLSVPLLADRASELASEGVFYRHRLQLWIGLTVAIAAVSALQGAGEPELLAFGIPFTLGNLVIVIRLAVGYAAWRKRAGRLS